MKKKPLNQELYDEPYSFEFFQAVRLLEKMFPERPAVGRDALPVTEVVRFRSHPTLDFPASELWELREVDEDFTDYRKLEMFVNFMGMIGAVGVLPTHYNELVIDRARYRDTALWAFLDIYTHRIISLFFRAWEKYRFPVDYERSQKEKQRTDDFTRFLFDFVGLGTRGLRGRLDLPDESLLPYSGLVSNRPHSTVALRSMVSDYFSVPVKIEQFFGQWIDLDEDYILQIGTSDFKLGMNTVLGTRIWDDQSKFRVRVGPMTFDKFKAFLPNGSAHKEAFSMIRFFVGLEFDFDLQLVLMAKQVPSCVLTTRAKRRPQLGWTTWLKTKPFKQDDEQVVLAAR